MKKLPAKKIIEYRRLSDKSKMTFLKNLRSPKPKTEEGGGGDYWVSCISAINSACIESNPKIIKARIDDLLDRQEQESRSQIKLMYKGNINILNNYKSDDFSRLKPNRKLDFLKIPKNKFILHLSGLPIQISPTHVFIFKNKGVDEIGALWFVALKGGYTKPELGVFTELLHRYLVANYSNDYTVNPNYCIAIDVVNCIEVKHSSLKNNKRESLLDLTLNEIKETLKKI